MKRAHDCYNMETFDPEYIIIQNTSFQFNLSLTVVYL